jgi:hypothetical protein
VDSSNKEGFFEMAFVPKVSELKTAYNKTESVTDATPEQMEAMRDLIVHLKDEPSIKKELTRSLFSGYATDYNQFVFAQDPDTLSKLLDKPIKNYYDFFIICAYPTFDETVKPVADYIGRTAITNYNRVLPANKPRYVAIRDAITPLLTLSEKAAGEYIINHSTLLEEFRKTTLLKYTKFLEDELLAAPLNLSEKGISIADLIDAYTQIISASSDADIKGVVDQLSELIDSDYIFFDGKISLESVAAMHGFTGIKIITQLAEPWAKLSHKFYDFMVYGGGNLNIKIEKFTRSNWIAMFVVAMINSPKNMDFCFFRAAYGASEEAKNNMAELMDNILYAYTNSYGLHIRPEVVTNIVGPCLQNGIYIADAVKEIITDINDYNLPVDQSVYDALKIVIDDNVEEIKMGAPHAYARLMHFSPEAIAERARAAIAAREKAMEELKARADQVRLRRQAIRGQGKPYNIADAKYTDEQAGTVIRNWYTVPHAAAVTRVMLPNATRSIGAIMLGKDYARGEGGNIIYIRPENLSGSLSSLVYSIASPKLYSPPNFTISLSSLLESYGAEFSQLYVASRKSLEEINREHPSRLPISGYVMIGKTWDDKAIAINHKGFVGWGNGSVARSFEGFKRESGYRPENNAAVNDSFIPTFKDFIL